jgi:hypothetical protein
MRQRANVLARKLLVEHHPHPLTPTQEAEIDKMVRAFQARSGGLSNL